jgi:hypothetical protein
MDEGKRMRVPPIVCEYPGLPHVWEFAGIPFIPPWPEQEEDIAALDGIPSSFVALSPRSLLLRQPRWAWLSLPHVHFYHLPPLNELRPLFMRCPPSVPTDETSIRMLHPSGQWLWALEQLEQQLWVGNAQDVEGRLQALRRFSARRWRNWFEQALGHLEQHIKSGDCKSARQTIETMAAYSEEVAALQTLAMLLQNTEHNIAEIVGPLHLVLKNATRGFYSLDYVRSCKEMQKLVALSPSVEKMNAELSLMEHCELNSAGIAQTIREISVILNSIAAFIMPGHTDKTYRPTLQETSPQTETSSKVDILAMAGNLEKLITQIRELQGRKSELEGRLGFCHAEP